jgi:hypothetical protein
MTIQERDKLRARRVAHFVDRSSADAAKVAERERRNMVMRNETGVLGDSVKDTGWNGVPQGIPVNKYPNKESRKRYTVLNRDRLGRPLPEPIRPPIEQVLVLPEHQPVLIEQRASDARGRTEGVIPTYGIRPWKLHELPDIVTRGLP